VTSAKGPPVTRSGCITARSSRPAPLAILIDGFTIDWPYASQFFDDLRGRPIVDIDVEHLGFVRALRDATPEQPSEIVVGRRERKPKDNDAICGAQFAVSQTPEETQLRELGKALHHCWGDQHAHKWCTTHITEVARLIMNAGAPHPVREERPVI